MPTHALIILLIYSYQYDDGPDRVEALQEYEIVKLPSVLYIHLKRFNYDIETNISKKNNKRFDFYPTLDLSQYCDDAAYTLHSVLGEFEFMREC